MSFNVAFVPISRSRFKQCQIAPLRTFSNVLRFCVNFWIACRTGVIFCVFQANRGESEASAWRARVACEGRSAKKSRLSPYHCSSRSGVQIWTRLPNWLLWNTWSSNVFPRRNTITYSDLNTTDRFALKLFGEFNWKYSPMGLICSL